MAIQKINFSPSFVVPLLLMAVWISACSSMTPIATDVGFKYEEGAEGISRYRIEFEEMPEFLKPMLRDTASMALASKGLEYTEGAADAVLLMSFVQKPLTTEDSNRDDFSGTLSPSSKSRFIAEVHVELKNSADGELIWSGILSRYHSIAMGSYMHDAPSRAAMAQAFLEIFADYPQAIARPI